MRTRLSGFLLVPATLSMLTCSSGREHIQASRMWADAKECQAVIHRLQWTSHQMPKGMPNVPEAQVRYRTGPQGTRREFLFRNRIWDKRMPDSFPSDECYQLAPPVTKPVRTECTEWVEGGELHPPPPPKGWYPETPKLPAVEAEVALRTRPAQFPPVVPLVSPDGRYVMVFSRETVPTWTTIPGVQAPHNRPYLTIYSVATGQKVFEFAGKETGWETALSWAGDHSQAMMFWVLGPTDVLVISFQHHGEGGDGGGRNR